MCFPFLTCFRSECDPQYSNGECIRYYRRQRRRHLVVMWYPVEMDGVRNIEAELEDHLPLAAKREVDLGLVLIKYTCTHQHTVIPSNRLIFAGRFLSMQAGRHSTIVGPSGETKYGIECLALVMRSTPVKRSCSGGNVTRCKVDFSVSRAHVRQPRRVKSDTYKHHLPLLHRWRRPPTFITIASLSAGAAIKLSYLKTPTVVSRPERAS